jgi:hypothetical protein
LGFNFFYALEIFSAKEKAEINISHNPAIQELHFLKSDLSKLLVDKNEIRWHENLYDIVSKKESGNNVILKVIKDNYETELINWFDGLPNKKETENNFMKFIFSVFIIPASSFKFKIEEFFRQIFKTPFIKYSFSLVILSPPPQ